MKRIIPIAVLLCCAITAMGQSRPAVTVRAVRQGDSLTLYAAKEIPGVWSVMVRYPSAPGGARVYYDTVANSRKFITLCAEGARQLAGKKFSVETELGNAWGVIDTSVMYRLPYSVKKTNVIYSLAIEGGWIAHVFRLSQGDTIFAARRGTAIRINEVGPNMAPPSKSFNLRGIEIVVQHLDGSWAIYRGLTEGSAMVVPGQTVWPDTPIGLAGDNRKYGWSVLLSIECPVVGTKKGRREFMLADIEPSFAIASLKPLAGKELTYILVPRADYEMLIREMSREDAQTMGPFQHTAGGVP